MASRIIIKKTGSASYLFGLQKAFHSKLMNYPGFVKATSYLETPNRDKVITISKWETYNDWETWYNSNERKDCIKLAELNASTTNPKPKEEIICYANKITTYQLEDSPFLL